MTRGIIERVRLGLSTHGISLAVGCALVVAVSSLHAAHVWPWTPPPEPQPAREPTTTRTEPEATRAELPSITRVAGQHVDVDVVAAACHVGVECAVKLQVTARGAFHVNQEYPHKFVNDEGPTFRPSRETFRRPDDDATTITVTFVPKALGAAPLSGILKTSACDNEVCVVETPHLTVAVPIT